MFPIVAIIGRPNVGKSTLFNRLIGRREAIVEDIAGVTRDRNYGQAEWVGKTFMVIDTGGFVPEAEDVFEQGIVKQIGIALEEADAVIFLVDIRDGVTPTDYEIAELIRRSGKRCIMVANKCDNADYDSLAVAFYELGLGDLYSISALNGRQTGDMLDAVTDTFPDNMEDEVEDSRLKIALIGRPNVGKSSIANALIGEERFIVTPVAGTTRDALDSVFKYHGEEIVLIDTAGLRKRKKVNEAIELFSTFRTVRAIDRCDVAVLVIDASVGLEKQDIKVLEEAAERRKGLIIAVNKWDLVEKDTMTSKRFEEAIKGMIPTFDYVPIMFISAVTKQRLLKLIDLAKEVREERAKRISTSNLNEVLLEAIANHPPPAVRGKDLRIKFIQQPQASPPVFLMYTNYPELVPEHYTRYLQNIVRQHFGFQGVPLTLVYKQKNKMRAEL